MRRHFIPALLALCFLLQGEARSRITSLVRIPYKGPQQIKALLERKFDIVSFSKEGYLDVAAGPKEIEELFSLGYPASIIATPEMALSAPALDQYLGLYHTYAEMESTLLSLGMVYPSLARVDTIGFSYQGRPIYSIKISDNADLEEAEPEVLIMGNHHARELMSVEIPLKFAEYLLGNYSSDPSVQDMVDNRQIFIVPMINPDGHVYVENNHSGAWWSWWRKNRRWNGDGSVGVDLNRNYGYMWGYDNFGSSPNPSSQVYRGTGPFSESETQAIRDLCQAHGFSLALSYHSYGELLLYPWGYVYDYTADHELFSSLGDTLSSSNGYYPGNPVLGAIYLTNGDTDDWAYGDDVTKNAIFSLTVEVNTSSEGGFAPPDTLIEPTFLKLLPMNMQLLVLAENPYKLLGPERPAMYQIDDGLYPVFRLHWTPSNPEDQNPALSYEVWEYKNLTTTHTDSADSLSGLWNFDGFTLGSRAYEGSGSYYSGNANNLSNTIELATSFQVSSEADTFSCWMWYDIEPDYDYAYVELSTDDGLTWETIAGNVTTTSNPYGSNHGNGITGYSGGWVPAIFPLDSYLGSDVILRIHYVTDTYITGEGLYVDVLSPVPTYDSLSVLTESVTDTFFYVNPQSIGTFTYRVRGKDDEEHLSRWSNSVSISIDQIVSADRLLSLPKSWLGQNYPNPFNPITSIPFHIAPADGKDVPVRVLLTIYTVTGAEVAVLYDQPMAPGTYEAKWDGKGPGGEPLPSGVYFARLAVGGKQSFTTKLVLLK